jgi:hypothetical protein
MFAIILFFLGGKPAKMHFLRKTLQLKKIIIFDDLKLKKNPRN